MAAPARNIAFPIFVLVILAFLLLLFLMMWLWETPGAGEVLEQGSETEAPVVRSSFPPDVAEAALPMAASESEAQPTVGEAPAAAAAAPSGETAIPSSTAGTEVYAEAPIAAPSRGTGESGGERATSAGAGSGSSAAHSQSRQETSGTAGGSQGSTYVAIPEVQQQPPPTPAPEDALQETEPDEESIEEEEPPEPPSRKKEKPEEEPPTSTPIIQAIPTLTELSVGGRLSVAVSISNATNVSHVPFHLQFDPQVLQFDYGEEGSFLGSDGAQTAFFAAPSSSGGTVVVGLSRLGQARGVSGSGELCVLHFTAVGPGTTALAFSREKVRDASSRIVPSVFVPVSITVM